MIRIDSVLDGSMEWLRLRGNRFELRAGDKLVAVLQCDEPCGLTATGEAADGSWAFRCTGFFEARFAVRAIGQTRDMAAIRPEKGGGVLEFPAGRTFRWRRTDKRQGFLDSRREWSWLDAAGHVLAIYEPEADRWFEEFTLRAKVAIAPEAVGVAELSLLLLMGWYMVLVHHDDEAAVIAALATVTDSNL